MDAQERLLQVIQTRDEIGVIELATELLDRRPTSRDIDTLAAITRCLKTLGWIKTVKYNRHGQKIVTWDRPRLTQDLAYVSSVRDGDDLKEIRVRDMTTSKEFTLKS